MLSDIFTERQLTVNDSFKIATEYINAGLCVLPATKAEKRPLGKWKLYADPDCREMPNPEAFKYGRHDAIAIVCGAVSGNLEVMDFDDGASAFNDFKKIAGTEILKNVVIQKTQSGGLHLLYRCKDIEGNLKLASKESVKGQSQVLIETRGQGGLIIAAPTPGYEVIGGDILNVPQITPEQREDLLSAARSLNRDITPPKPVHKRKKHSPEGVDRPGDDYNANGDVDALLREHGWQFAVEEGGRKHYRRPGKTTGVSGNWNGSYFYCHTTSSVLEVGCYDLFGLYAALNCWEIPRAAAELKKLGYGSDKPETVVPENLVPEPVKIDIDACMINPGGFPEKLLNVPGLIGQILDYNNDTAHKQQPELALAASICLMSVLIGGKVRDVSDMRANVYVIGTAGSSSGKDHARKLNRKILHLAGADSLEPGEEIASDTALLSTLKSMVNPCMLLQLDEVGRFLHSMSNKKASHLYKIGETLMKLYTSSNSYFKGRLYANTKDNIEPIKEPHVSLYGTTVASHLYSGLTTEMLADGFLGRVIMIEGRTDPEHRDIESVPAIPQCIIDAAKAWYRYEPAGSGNIGLQARIITYTDNAKVYLRKRTRAVGNRKYSSEFERAMFGRVIEKAKKLALIYVCSRVARPSDSIDFFVDLEAIQWAFELVDYATQLTLYRAGLNVAETSLERDSLEMLRYIQEQPAGVSLTMIARKFRKLYKRDRSEILETLVEAGQIVCDPVQQSKGAPTKAYRAVV
jgi:hypothetical protein